MINTPALRLTKPMAPFLLGLCLLFTTTERLPAPISEVPESPTPAPEQSAKPKPNAKASESKTKAKAKPTALESPSAKPKAKSSLASDGHNLQYAGRWR